MLEKFITISLTSRFASSTKPSLALRINATVLARRGPAQNVAFTRDAYSASSCDENLSCLKNRKKMLTIREIPLSKVLSVGFHLDVAARMKTRKKVDEKTEFPFPRRIDFIRGGQPHWRPSFGPKNMDQGELPGDVLCDEGFFRKLFLRESKEKAAAKVRSISSSDRPEHFRDRD